MIGYGRPVFHTLAACYLKFYFFFLINVCFSSLQIVILIISIVFSDQESCKLEPQSYPRRFEQIVTIDSFKCWSIQNMFRYEVMMLRSQLPTAYMQERNLTPLDGTHAYAS